MPRRDTKPLAKALIARFGTLRRGHERPPELLKRGARARRGRHHRAQAGAAAALRLMRGEVLRAPGALLLGAVLDYCRAAMGFAHASSSASCFSTSKNQLIADEVQQNGTVDHAPVYVREVVKRALELSASAIILVHNHPSGDPTPSRADIEMTEQIVAAAKPLGVRSRPHHRRPARPRELPRPRVDLAPPHKRQACPRMAQARPNECRFHAVSPP